MSIVYKPIHYLEYLYGPADIDHRFYENIIEIYEEIMHRKCQTPLYEEIEEWVFQGIIKKIVRDNDHRFVNDRRYQMDYYYRQEVNDESIREFLESYAKSITLDIKRCLRHANLSYISDESEKNSPQIKLFNVYDEYGHSV